MPDKELFIGIDLGTTNSAVAWLGPSGVPQLLNNDLDERLTPSAILFDHTNVIVGRMALDNATAFPQNVAQGFKRYMGEEDYSFDCEGRQYSATDLSALVLEKLKADAESRLGQPLPPVVITVPAYFGDPQRRATLDAAAKAGLKVSLLLNEPTAAAYAYGLENLGGAQSVMVFDLGGGTFDVTVMRMHDTQIEVVATGGDHHLGGRDWDEALMQHIAETFRSQYGDDLYADDESYSMLREQAVKAKISLSSLPKVPVTLHARGHSLRAELTRSAFESMTRSLVERCLLLTQMVLEEAHMTPNQIDTILLVGGSSRMPMVFEKVKALFGKEPNGDLNPDESVALGAAIKSALIAREQGRLVKLSSPREGRLLRMKDRNVTSHSFGLVTFRNGTLYNSIIIPKNTPFPCELHRSDYITTAENQTSIRVILTEGEDSDPYRCDLIGHYEAYGLPPAPAGRRIRFTYRYNQNQVVEVKAHDLTANKPLSVRSLPKKPILAEIAQPSLVDVVFVMDFTGSMTGYINAVKEQAFAFADALQRRDLDWSLGFVSFGDCFLKEPIGVRPFTQSVESFKREVAAQPMLQGGDEPESQVDAIFAALGMPFRYRAKPIIILVTDAPPHDPDASGRTALQALALAREVGSTLFVVGPNRPIYASLTAETGGTLYAINRSEEMAGILDRMSGRIADLVTEVSSTDLQRK